MNGADEQRAINVVDMTVRWARPLTMSADLVESLRNMNLVCDENRSVHFGVGDDEYVMLRDIGQADELVLIAYGCGEHENCTAAYKVRNPEAENISRSWNSWCLASDENSEVLS